jgi:hypothetical protein
MSSIATVQVNIINHFIRKYNYKSYLEVGTGTSHGTFPYIQIEYKEGIDILENEHSTNEYKLLRIDSDTYFNNLTTDTIFDIIHIDGNHEKGQVRKDILNSLNHLSNNGTIVCHDVEPVCQTDLNRSVCYNAWEAFAEFRATNKDLYMYVIKNSNCGIIQRGHQQLWTKKLESGWNYYDENKTTMMNIIDNISNIPQSDHI